MCGGHIWRAQHRDASHAKVTSQISVGSMPRPKFWVWKWGGGTNISLPPPPSEKWGGGHMPPLPPPRFLRQCHVHVLVDRWIDRSLGPKYKLHYPIIVIWWLYCQARWRTSFYTRPVTGCSICKVERLAPVRQHCAHNNKGCLLNVYLVYWGLFGNDSVSPLYTMTYTFQHFHVCTFIL